MLSNELEIGMLSPTDSAPSNKVVTLQQILAEEQQRPVELAEAQEIGDALLAFYRVLAEEGKSDGTTE